MRWNVFLWCVRGVFGGFWGVLDRFECVIRDESAKKWTFEKSRKWPIGRVPLGQNPIGRGPRSKSVIFRSSKYALGCVFMVCGGYFRGVLGGFEQVRVRDSR